MTDGRTTYVYVWYLAEFFLEWEKFQTKVAEKIKTQVTWYFFFFENRVVYEMMWKNMVELDMTQMIRRRKDRFASGINKAHTQNT